MILYRPVGLQELALIYDSGMKAFPTRLPKQPIFYPVLQLEYARKTAAGWNAKKGESAGYVTEFKVEDKYIDQFEEHAVGKSQHQELWIPAEELEEFNKHIVGHIKVVEAHFGNAFEGFIPEQFGLQGKKAVEQFTWLANSYVYKRMDFYLEIKRNHKAVFLNYPFWQTHDSKNPGLKEKTLQAIKEAWLASFPKIPLPLPPAVREDTSLVKRTESHAQQPRKAVREDIWAEPVDEEPAPVKPTNSSFLVKPVREEITPIEQSDEDEQYLADLEEEEDAATTPELPSLVNPVREEITPAEQTDEDDWADPEDEEPTTDSRLLVNPVHEEVTPVEQSDASVPARHWVSPVHKEATLPKQTNSHFVQGIKFGLSGEYHPAIAELSKAVEEDPDNTAAHTSLGVAFHRLGEDNRALACYETALKIDPIYAEAHYFRANILYLRGSVREAIAGYTVAIGLQPELIEAHQKPSPEDRLTDYSLASAQMRRIAKPAHRILELNKLLEANPGQANLFKERAAEYYRLRNYAQAITDYSSSLALQPDDAGALHLRGVAYEQLGQSDRALEDYQQAIAINPQLSNEYINRGVTFGQMGNLHQSIANLTEAIRLAPKNPDAYFNRGTVYIQQGDFQRAIGDFSMVIQLSSNDEEAYYWRGIAYEQTGGQREAIADYRQFLALSQDENARLQIQQKLSQWDEGKQNDVGKQSGVPDDRPKTNQAQVEKPDQSLDIYDLIAALGERALNSTWFGSGVNCNGEKAEELYALTEHNRPIEGRDFLSIASGIRKTRQGDFQAFDAGANAPWVFIRAWEGSGFYVETNDHKIKERLKTHFQSAEEVDGASASYEGLFLPI